jgi:DNA-binding MarR family transcriptional regulator
MYIHASRFVRQPSFTALRPRRHAVTQTDDFVGCFAGNLREATRAVSRLYDAHLQDAGLKITQVSVLAQIDRLGQPSPTELGTELGLDRSSVARELQTLEGAGLVVRVADPGDARARRAHLTPTGRRRLESAAAGWRAAQAELARRLGTKDAEALLSMARKIVAATSAPK